MTRRLLDQTDQCLKNIQAALVEAGADFADVVRVMNGDDATYTRLESRLNNLTDERNTIAQKMITLLEGAVFENKAVNEREAAFLILESDALIASTSIW